MALRHPSFRVVGLTCILILGSLVGTVVHAQDRGAPRFEPAASEDTVVAESSDAGRLWSIADPPFDRFKERYEMEADSAWATHLRRGILRLPGCTAALVSAEGLALTTARCVRRHLEAENDGAALVAEQRTDERSVSGLHADRLVRTTDVTAAVRAARQDTAVAQGVRSVEQRLQSEAEANQRVEVVSAAGGASYTAYTYRRYEDVRVVFLPERSVSAFGGIDAAMTYPRQALDVALLRMYTAEGTPLAADQFFEPSTQGVRPGDAVFSAGASGQTHRLKSAEQLAVRRDLMLPARRARLEAWSQAMRASLDTATAAPLEALHEAERALKQTKARLQALQNEYVQSRLQRRDAQLRRALRQDSSLQDQFGGVLDSLAAIQDAKRSLASAYRAFGRFGGESRPPSGSSTYRRILWAGRQEAAGSASETEETEASVAAEDSVRSLPASVEIAVLAFRLDALRSHLYPDTAAVRHLLQGRSPTQLATAIVESSVLATPADASAGAATPEVPPNDPATAVIDVVAPRARSFYEEWTRLNRTERQLTRRLVRARQAVRTAPVMPGGEGALRLTDGRVLGYPYNGTMAPPFTTFFGLYEQNRAFGEDGAWALPERWRRSASTMDRSTPLNLVASTDGAVSTSGAPLLNKYLELVGVTVGPNIQSVAGTYIFLPERMRTVAVDLRGLRQALTAVYEAEGLVSELFGEGSETADTRP